MYEQLRLSSVIVKIIEPRIMVIILYIIYNFYLNLKTKLNHEKNFTFIIEHVANI